MRLSRLHFLKEQQNTQMFNENSFSALNHNFTLQSILFQSTVLLYKTKNHLICFLSLIQSFVNNYLISI